MGKEYYYQIAAKASEDFSANVGLETLYKLALKAKSILDVGCGEATRLALLKGESLRHGVDVEEYPISLGKKKYPELNLQKYDGTRLPFEDNQFELVYSTYVLEHTQEPLAFLDEMIRVTKPGGLVAVITPNYGAPNRRSPNNPHGKVTKLVRGLVEDFVFGERMEMDKVIPKPSYTQIDDDTTVEPYLRKIVRFFETRGLIKRSVLSMWEIDEGQGVFWVLLKRLGGLGVYPIRYWGPQAFVCYQK